MTHPATYADVILGDRPGYLAIAYGHDGYWAGGRYKYRTWTERTYRWRAGRNQLHQDVSRILAARERVDVFVCPAIRRAPDRRKGSALAPLILWTDLDRPPTDPALLAVLDPFTVHSGTAGHQHAYLPLTHPVDLGTHARLNQALAARLGGDAKWSDEALLRLPGTLNHKTTSPTAVTVAPWSGRVWSVNELTALLDVDFTTPITPMVPSVASEPLPQPLPQRVRWALGHPGVADRSIAHHRLVAACRDAGLTVGQAATVASGYPPSCEKYGARLVPEVARSWARVRGVRR